MTAPTSCVLDSNALVRSAITKRTQADPWRQFVDSHTQRFGSFSTSPTSMIKAYSMCANQPLQTQLYRNLDSVLAPFWANDPQHQIIDFHDKSNIKRMGEFMAHYLTKYSFEECQLAYVCDEYYPGTEICGIPSDLYSTLQITIAFDLS